MGKACNLTPREGQVRINRRPPRTTQPNGISAGMHRLRNGC